MKLRKKGSPCSGQLDATRKVSRGILGKKNSWNIEGGRWAGGEYSKKRRGIRGGERSTWGLRKGGLAWEERGGNVRKEVSGEFFRMPKKGKLEKKRSTRVHHESGYKRKGVRKKLRIQKSCASAGVGASKWGLSRNEGGGDALKMK